MRKGKWWLIGGLTGGIVAVHLIARHRQEVIRRQTSNAKVCVLVVGAGVVGTTYAVALARQGMEVVLLTQDARFDALHAHGVAVRDILTRQRREAPVHLVSRIPSQEYDLVILAMPPVQVPEALEALGAIRETTPVLIMQSRPMGEKLLAGGGEEPSLLLGFPATEGVIVEGEVYGLPFYLGSTVIGESDGAATQRLQQTASILRRAGLEVQVERHILPWLQTHAAMVAVLGACVLKNEGNMHRLARDPDEVHLYLAGLREAYQALEASGIPITPRRQLQVFERPLWLETALVQLAVLPPWMRFVTDCHVQANRDTLQATYEHLLQLAEHTGILCPTLRSLGPYFSTSRH